MSSKTEFEKLSREMAHIPIYLRDLSLVQILEQPLFVQMKKYAQLQFTDVYKFIYQGSCGWAHLSKLGDNAHIKHYLAEELSTATETKDFDELLETLDFKSGLGRVNLRAWKEQFGDDIQLLWKLMLRAQNNSPTTMDLFIERWEEFSKWINQKVITYPIEAEKLVTEWLKLVHIIALEIKEPIELPMVSHSPMYKMYYTPSYRIIMEEDLFPY